MNNSIALLAILLLLTGCSTSFNREYKTAIAQPIPSNDISGPWEGKWLSDKNGHTGKLRAVLRQTSSNEYDAHFHATFWKIFRTSYRIPLNVEQENGRTILHGEQNLGRLSGGLYTYEGEATPSNFFATYKSKYDHGTFEMKRPGLSQPAPTESPQTPADK